jgi:tetratricopeptide (TPR) repeat protein
MWNTKDETAEPTRLESIMQAVEKNPTDIDNHLRLGWTYYGEEQYEAAESAFQAAIDRFPDDVEARYAFGLTLKKLGKEQEALSQFKQVIEKAEDLEDQIRGEMLRRLAIGHSNIMEKGDWDLSGEIWERK